MTANDTGRWAENSETQSCLSSRLVKSQAPLIKEITAFCIVSITQRYFQARQTSFANVRVPEQNRNKTGTDKCVAQVYENGGVNEAI